MTFSWTAHSFTCCAWSAELTSTAVLSLRALRVLVCDLKKAQLLWVVSTSFLALANGLSTTSIVFRVLCFGDVSHRSSSSCGHRVGHVPHGQWALLGTDTLVLVDWSACLLEPCTWWLAHEALAPHGPLTVFFVSPIVVSLRRVVLAPSSHLLREILTCSWMVCSFHCTVS